MELELHLLEEPKVMARIATGHEVELRVSRAVIRINNLSTLCTAYTTLGVRRALLGREVLKKTGLLYKPPNRLEINS